MFAPLDEKEEQALLDAAAGTGARREAALRRIYEVLRAPVLKLCLTMSKSPSDAEDATQETFAAAFRALSLFRRDARLSTWVFRIAVRAAIEQRSKHKATVELDPETPSATSGESDLLARDEARRMLSAIQCLSLEHRTVLALFGVEGLRHREIADVLGVPEGTVWSRLSLARKALTAEMNRPRLAFSANGLRGGKLPRAAE